MEVVDMLNKVAIGIQDFEKIIEGSYFYIDKTAFIKEWWECGDDVTLITRPRRFGKTLNMSMLNCFFSKEYEGKGYLFEGLSIWKDEKFRELQGTYPVINLSFAYIKETEFELTTKRILELLMSQFEKYSFIMQSDRFSENEKSYIKRMAKEMTLFDAGTSLHRLSEYLCRYYDKKVLILLDEYDTPMQEAYVNGFWDEMVAFTRSLFNATFKTNPWLARGYLKVIRYDDLATLERGRKVCYEVALTNYEVRQMFESMVNDWFSPAAEDYNDFIKAMLLGNCKAMNAYMNKVAMETFSYFDTGKRKSGQEPERFYHGFVLGLMVELQADYIITSNCESGFGR